MIYSQYLRHTFLYTSFLVGLTLAPTATMFGMELEEFTQALANTPRNPHAHIVVERDINFTPNPQLLAQDHMQISVAMFNPRTFLASSFARWDLDGLQHSLASDEMTMVTRSAVIIRDKTPQFFNFDQITAPDYLAVAFYDTKNEASADDESVINCSRSYFSFSVNSKIRFQTFDLSSEARRHMDKATGEALLANAPAQEGLEMITSSYSLPGDISLGSHGGRTANYYYRLGEHATLHISHKLVTFKKEARYDFFAVRFLHIWDNILASAPHEQQQGSWRNIVNIRAY